MPRVRRLAADGARQATYSVSLSWKYIKELYTSNMINVYLTQSYMDYPGPGKLFF